MHTATRILLVSALAVVPAAAQLPQHYVVVGDDGADHLGQEVADAGDVNGDGHADFIVGIPNDNPAGFIFPTGAARVYSGLDGTELYTFLGTLSSGGFGEAVGGAGDVDGDGFDDLVVGAPDTDENGTGSGSAFWYSGADGSLIRTTFGSSAFMTHGFAVSGVGDVDGDGHDDVVIGERNQAQARVLSGADGSTLHTFQGEPSTQVFGDAVGRVGDVDGDGVPDVGVGDFSHFVDSATGRGGAGFVFSGATGALLWKWAGDASNDHMGSSISGVGDIDGDGFDDVAVGAEWDDESGSNTGGVYVFSGQTGALLHRFDGDVAEGYLGSSVSGGGDLNGDGVPDIVAGARSSSSVVGYARAWSGADGTLLETFATGAADQFGVSAALVGDVNGDGLAEVLVGANAGAGAAHMLAVAGARGYGIGAGPDQSLDLAWEPSVGPAPALGTAVLSGAQPGAAGLLLVGGLPDQLVIQDVTLLVDLFGSGITLIHPFTADGSGTFGVTGSLQSAALDGMLLYLQFVALDPGAPGAYASSNGLELLFSN